MITPELHLENKYVIGYSNVYNTGHCERVEEERNKNPTFRTIEIEHSRDSNRVKYFLIHKVLDGLLYLRHQVNSGYLCCNYLPFLIEKL